MAEKSIDVYSLYIKWQFRNINAWYHHIILALCVYLYIFFYRLVSHQTEHDCGGGHQPIIISATRFVLTQTMWTKSKIECIIGQQTGKRSKLFNYHSFYLIGHSFFVVGPHCRPFSDTFGIMNIAFKTSITQDFNLPFKYCHFPFPACQSAFLFSE